MGFICSQEELPSISTSRRKVIKQVPISRPAEPTFDEAALQQQREAQEAEAAMYNSTRLLPTIHDPKIFSVRVRVSFCVVLFICSVVLRCRLFSL